MDIFDIAGWIGMACVLAAYLLLSLGKIKNGIFYQLLNLIAGIFMAIGLFPKNAWFSFALQIIWSLIAIISIIKIKTQPAKPAAKSPAKSTKSKKKSSKSTK